MQHDFRDRLQIQIGEVDRVAARIFHAQVPHRFLFFRRELPKVPTFAERVDLLRRAGFSTQSLADGRIKIAKHGMRNSNVLAIAPREVVMVKGNPETKKRMEAAGCKVHVIEADAISVMVSCE